MKPQDDGQDTGPRKASKPDAGDPARPDAPGTVAETVHGAAPGLSLVATPIGNLRDITLRALDTLRAADIVACEDSRISKRLLDRYGIAARLVPYHEHNAARARPQLLAALAGGSRVALISDAGTPLVSDPGFKLVREAVEAGIPVTAIPGPSALLAALQLSALPTDRFYFAGFLPPKPTARRRALADLQAVPGTLVFYESGPRLAAALADMATAFGDRRAAVARELTKRFEEVRRDGLAALAAHYAAAGPPRGEIAVVVGPADAVAEDAAASDPSAAIGAALEVEFAGGATVRDAADAVAARLRLPRRLVYRHALDRAGQAGDADR